jgi:peptidoglycan/LPS O-acetylase OafA/YrhL
MSILARSASPTSRIRFDIQALRAIAVLAVVAYHIWPTRLTGGFMGVDVFFVISGYLMTLTIWKGVKEANCQGEHRVKNSLGFLFRFYARRIKRLAPAATVCLLAVLATVLLVRNFSLQMATAPQVFASTVFMQNWFLADQAVDYLGADAGATAVQHFWSLSIEEQFYMVWPLLLLVVGFVVFARAEVKKTNAAAATTTTTTLVPLIVISLFTAISFAYGLYLTYHNASAAYFVTTARIWELSLGGIIVFLPTLKNRDLRLLLPWTGIALIAYSMLKGTGEAFPGWHALIPTLGTLLVIYGGETQHQQTTDRTEASFSFANLSRFRPAQFFGDISYSLYLYHWPLVVLVPFILQADLNHHGRYLKFIVLAASVALAWLSYALVESPTRKLKPKRIAAAKIWAAGAACLAVILISAHTIEARAIDYTNNIIEKAFERATDPGDTGFGARATQHRDQFPDPYGQVDAEWAQFASTSFSGTINEPGEKFNFYTGVSSNAGVDTIGEFGDMSTERYILVLGDSYSQQWYPALDIAGRNLGFKVIAANAISAGSGLFELDYRFGETWTSSNGDECSVARANERFNWIRDSLWKDADVVVVGISAGTFVGTDKDPASSSDAPSKLAATFKELSAATGSKPILIQSTSSVSFRLF